MAQQKYNWLNDKELQEVLRGSLRDEIINYLDSLPEKYVNNVNERLHKEMFRELAQGNISFPNSKKLLEILKSIPLSEEKTFNVTMLKPILLEHLTMDETNLKTLEWANFCGRRDHHILIDCSELTPNELFCNYNKLPYGCIIKSIIDSYSLSPMLVFWNTKNLYDQDCLKHICLESSREEFVDNYLKFPINLKNMIIIFVNDGSVKVPNWLINMVEKLDLSVSRNHSFTNDQRFDHPISSINSWPNIGIHKPVNPMIQPDPKNFKINLNETVNTNMGLDEHTAKILNIDGINVLTFEHRYQYNFDIESVIQIKIISNKTNNKVAHYKHIRSKTEMAIKFVRIPTYMKHDTSNNKLFELLIEEIKNLGKLSSYPNFVGSENSNIVELYGVAVYENEVLFCMELMDFSLLQYYQWFHKQMSNQIFPEQMIAFIAVSILDALAFCQSNNIIHRDIKPSNILMRRDGDIKLADFGISRELQHSQANTNVGTKAYLAPERYSLTSERKTYDIKSDIWAYGITLCEVINNGLPFDDLDKNAYVKTFMIEMIVSQANGKEIVEKVLNGKYSEDLKNFLNKCLQKVEIRAKCEDLLNTKFYLEHKPGAKKETIKEYTKNYV